MNTKEIWRKISGYEGLYEISNHGRIRSLYNGRITVGKITKAGYLAYGLYKNKKRQLVLVHRLVAEAFIPNVKKKPFVDHINCVRTDNYVENLRWVTAKENANNVITLQRYKDRPRSVISQEAKQRMSIERMGKNNPFYQKTHNEDFILRISKPIVQVSLNDNLIKVWQSATEASKFFNVSSVAIRRCCSGLSKTSKGYKWYYKKDYDNRNPTSTAETVAQIE